MARPPSSGRVTSAYGWRIHPITGSRKFHAGEDTVGAGNVAPVSGTVVFAQFDDTGAGFGNAVGVRQKSDPSVIWWMAHHKTIAVDVGDKVSAGDRLGELGATGAATGPHVHTERRVGGSATPRSGTPTNPRDYYTSTAGDDREPIIEPAVRRKGEGIMFLEGKQPGGTVRVYVVAGLAGDPWVEFGIDPTTYDSLESQYGKPILCSDTTMEKFKARFESAVPVSVTVTGAPTAAQNAAAVKAALSPVIPTAAQNGAAARAAIVKPA